MLSLACLGECVGGYSTSDGRLVVALPAGTRWEILTAELDELERRGWVTLDPPKEGDAPNTARVRVTDAGSHWLKRWAKKNKRELARMAANTLTACPASKRTWEVPTC